jgi:hypothetical protein
MSKNLIYLILIILVLSMARIASADLVAHWSFDEGSSDTAYDSSGSGHDGTLMGDPQWVAGKVGGAMSFDGFSDQADHTTDPGNINWVSVEPFDVVGPGITMAAWIKPDGFDISDARIVTKQKTWSSIDIWWMLSTYTDGTALRMRLKTDDGGADGGTTTMWSDPGYLEAGVWSHAAATYDGSRMRLYHNGVEIMSTNKTGTIQTDPTAAVAIGNSPLGDPGGLRATFHGLIDDLRIYDSALGEQELLGIMEGEGYPFAFSPRPADGAIHEDTWVTLGWSPGDFAVSHDVYLGDNLNDVEDADRNSELFRGNQMTTFYVAGFPGYAYPDGLVPGTTYYWRIDEVNEVDPNSPWKGDIWSFSIPPRTAYNPNPADGAEFLGPDNVTLMWTPGFGAKLHTIYIGDDYDDVSSAATGVPSGSASCNAGTLEREKVYYWRVDEYDGVATYKGDIWGFTTPGAAGAPQPTNGAVDVAHTQILNWTPADNANSHQLYFGMDKDAVMNATTTSPEYKGSKNLGSESYDPGQLDWDKTYYWRVDAVYNADTVKGLVWSFTTADFLLIDDFESYTDDDAAGHAIWQTWVDGFGVADNGAQVGYLLPPYAEQTIVHGGAQSMPLLYVNEAGVTNSEATLTLTSQRDWTTQNVGELSLWFRGSSGNAIEPLYVAVSNATGAPAVVANDDVNAAKAGAWTQWVVPLQAFADQGINLANVNTLAIGLGTKSGTTSSGGSGTMYIDDIRLYRAEPQP